MGSYILLRLYLCPKCNYSAQILLIPFIVFYFLDALCTFCFYLQYYYLFSSPTKLVTVEHPFRPFCSKDNRHNLFLCFLAYPHTFSQCADFENLVHRFKKETATKSKARATNSMFKVYKIIFVNN